MTPADLIDEQFSPYERCRWQMCRCWYGPNAPRKCACTVTVSVHDMRAVLNAIHHATTEGSTMEQITDAFALAMTPNGGMK